MPTIRLSGRILLADTHPAHLQAVSQLLQQEGYEVFTAGNGAEAVARCHEIRPDLLLLDIAAGQMDGFAVMEELKLDPATRSIPVIFLTTRPHHEVLLKAFDAGAVDYLGKPLIPKELLARVNVHIGLKLTRNRLEQVAEERRNLVNLVAHDLKNPLSSVLFACEMLLQPDGQLEQAGHYAQIIRDATEDALGYIRTYLEQQKPRGTDAAQAATRLGDLLDWVQQRYRLQMQAQGVQLVVQCPEPAASVAMEPMALRQVMENLLSNALKYAADGGEVEVLALPAAQGFWQIRVQDRGSGIPLRHRQAMFKPFTRLEGESADGSSHGLGLALSRRMVDKAGGQLRYEDRAPQGACFIIDLPGA